MMRFIINNGLAEKSEIFENYIVPKVKIVKIVIGGANKMK